MILGVLERKRRDSTRVFKRKISKALERFRLLRFEQDPRKFSSSSLVGGSLRSTPFWKFCEIMFPGFSDFFLICDAQ